VNKFLTTLTPSKDGYRGELHCYDRLKRSGYEKSSLNVISVQTGRRKLEGKDNGYASKITLWY